MLVAKTSHFLFPDILTPMASYKNLQKLSSFSWYFLDIPQAFG